MKITMSAIVERQRARFMNKKSKKIAKRLKKKLHNSRCVFVYKKEYTLRYRIFHEIFEVGIYIQKASNFGLRDVFICKKLDTSQKPR